MNPWQWAVVGVAAVAATVGSFTEKKHPRVSLYANSAFYFCWGLAVGLAWLP